MRLHPRGWNTVGFDDADWEHACVRQADDHRCIPQVTPPVAFYMVKPRQVRRFSDTHFLLDFGTETVGCTVFSTNASGSVRVQWGEELLEDGHVRSNMRCSMRYDERWQLSGCGDEVRNFEYKGFRYMEVEAEDRAVLPEQFSVLARHYPAPGKARFTCSDKLFQQIWDICRARGDHCVARGVYRLPHPRKGAVSGRYDRDGAGARLHYRRCTAV